MREEEVAELWEGLDREGVWCQGAINKTRGPGRLWANCGEDCGLTLQGGWRQGLHTQSVI